MISKEEDRPGATNSEAANSPDNKAENNSQYSRYGDVAPCYAWGGLLPLPAGTKFPPPKGYTGEHGRAVGDAERAEWAGHVGNYALRMPPGVVGIDVDHYGAKRGLDTIAAVEAELGPLPATWTSTGRDIATGSGIRFYRYPGGKLAPVVGESVEVIQHGHRYAVVWPSNATGSDGTPLAYRWHRPDGTQAELPPAVGELAELPTHWADWLSAGASSSVGEPAPDGARDALHARLSADHRPPCGPMGNALHGALERLQAAGDGGRHDAATGGALGVVMAGAAGHAGAGVALAELEAAWHEAIGLDPARTGEFGRMVSTAAAKAATEYPTPLADSCAMMPVSSALPAVAPTDAGAPAQPPGGGWGPLDLSSYVDGTHKPEPATMLKRTDGHGLLYPGKVHAFNGEPESGKSMLAQWAVAVELDAGHDVLVLDYESDAATYVERLTAMGVARHAIVGHLSYLNPETDPTKNPAARAAMETLVASKSYTLAVLDGVTEALALAGADTNSGDDYTLWHKMVPRRIAKAGAAVVVVDHVTKATDGRGRFAIGSQAKLATLTGAAYLVDVTRPLGRGVVGELSLKVAKDRPGYVRGNAGRWSASTRLQEAARVIVDGAALGRIAVAVNPPEDDTDDDGKFRPTGLMAKVCRVLKDNGKPMALKPLREAVGGNSDAIGKAIDMLRDGEYITVEVGGPGKPTIHSLAKDYTEEDDPKLAGKRARNARSRFIPPEEGSPVDLSRTLKGSGPGVQVGETWTGQGLVQVGPGGPGANGGMGWKPPTLPAQVPGTAVESMTGPTFTPLATPTYADTLTGSREPVGTSGEPVASAPAINGEHATKAPRAGSLGWRPTTTPIDAATAAARIKNKENEK